MYGRFISFIYAQRPRWSYSPLCCSSHNRTGDNCHVLLRTLLHAPFLINIHEADRKRGWAYIHYLFIFLLFFKRGERRQWFRRPVQTKIGCLSQKGEDCNSVRITLSPCGLLWNVARSNPGGRHPAVRVAGDTAPTFYFWTRMEQLSSPGSSSSNRGLIKAVTKEQPRPPSYTQTKSLTKQTHRSCTFDLADEWFPASNKMRLWKK